MKIKDIKIDGGTQTRQQLDNEVIQNYSELMLNEVEFPAITVFYDGTNYWLADGFHRVEASKKAGFDEIEADIKQGNRRDAILYSVGANATHGLRRTNADKRRAVMTLLEDEEWSKKSDREISRLCCVGNKMVSDMRNSICVKNTDTPRTVERNGTVYEMKTQNIGKSIPDENKNFEKEANIGYSQQEIFPTGQPAETNREINYTSELVSEIYNTIERRYNKLTDNNKKIFINLLIEKLKKMEN